jgi:hypothetical protein
MRQQPARRQRVGLTVAWLSFWHGSASSDCTRDAKCLGAGSERPGLTRGPPKAWPPTRQRDFERIQPNLGIDHRNGAVDAVSVRFP